MDELSLQQQVSGGSRDAFAALFRTYGLGVYRQALAALASDDAARTAVKDVFSALYRALRSGAVYPDLSKAIHALTAETLAAAAPSPISENPQDAARPVETLVCAEASVEKDFEEPMAARPVRRVVPASEESSATDVPALDRAMRRTAGLRESTGASLPDRERPSRIANGLMIGCIVMFLLLVIWILIGILMDFGVLPSLDLGFSWFNRTFFTLFSL